MPADARRPLVLMYHAVDTRSGEDDPDNLFVPAERFARQLEVLEERGLTPCTLDAYVDGTAGPRSVLLTFDDAYASTLHVAAPLLAARRWPAVVYVSSATVGGTSYWNHDPHERLLDADELTELVRLGFTMGAHARNHVDLRGRRHDELRDEIAGSGQDLEDLFGVRMRTFAYPFGHHDAAARSAAETAGYDLAFSVYDGAGRFAVPRVDVNATDTDRSFRLKLSRAFPHVRKALGATPAVRRALHGLVGHASR